MSDSPAVFLTVAQVADRYHTKPAVIYDWRYRGYGPTGIRAGGRVLQPRRTGTMGR